MIPNKEAFDSLTEKAITIPLRKQVATNDASEAKPN